MEYYIIERRKGNIEIEDANCFLSSSMEKIIEWINSNKDYDKREFYWWWVVIKIKVNDEYGGKLFKVFDWDGNELYEQPYNNIIKTDIDGIIFSNYISMKNKNKALFEHLDKLITENKIKDFIFEKSWNNYNHPSLLKTIMVMIDDIDDIPNNIKIEIKNKYNEY